MTITKVLLLVVGSFNPPTIMHLRMFEIARDYLHQTGQFEVIGGIMSPVHDNYGKKGLAPSTHRKMMLKLALQSSDWISISEWESEQENWTPTRQVLQHHQNQINAALNSSWTPTKRRRFDERHWITRTLKHCNNQDKPVVKLLCGADVLETFAIPGLWLDEDIETIIRDHGIVVVTRFGSSTPKVIYDSDMLSKYQGNIIIVTEWITNEISSTKIRRAINRNQSVRYLVADLVIDYINKNHLYVVVDNKYELFPEVVSNMLLNTSHNDVVLMSSKISVDLPDHRENYICGQNEINLKHFIRRPGGAVQIIAELGSMNENVSLNSVKETSLPIEKENVPKVEIQITEDGTIQVISDKETTV